MSTTVTATSYFFHFQIFKIFRLSFVKFNSNCSKKKNLLLLRVLSMSVNLCDCDAVQSETLEGLLFVIESNAWTQMLSFEVLNAYCEHSCIGNIKHYLQSNCINCAPEMKKRTDSN